MAGNKSVCRDLGVAKPTYKAESGGPSCTSHLSQNAIYHIPHHEISPLFELHSYFFFIIIIAQSWEKRFLSLCRLFTPRPIYSLHSPVRLLHLEKQKGRTAPHIDLIIMHYPALVVAQQRETMAVLPGVVKYRLVNYNCYRMFGMFAESLMK